MTPVSFLYRYNFQPIQRYKALSAEEAEEEFNRRNKTMNYFSLMMKKRLRNDEEDHDDGEALEGKKKQNKKVKELKISEMDEWIDSDEEDSDEEEEDKKKSDDEDDKKKKKKGKQTLCNLPRDFMNKDLINRCVSYCR